MNMLKGFTLLLLFQLAGEVTVMLAGLPVPGPVVGMGLLLLYLVVRRPRGPGLEEASSGLLNHLSLLFVPAGVGVIVHVRRVEQEWVAIGAALVVSTLLTLVVTAWVMKLALRWKRPAPGGAHEE